MLAMWQYMHGGDIIAAVLLCRKRQLRNSKKPRKEAEQWKILSQDSRFQLISMNDSSSESEVM